MSQPETRSEAITRGFRVRVASQYLPEHSDPEHGQWHFAYQIEIRNEGDETGRLMSRHWIITDAEGREQEVRGEGVIGEQPELAPGEAFSYTSGCPLRSPTGAMRGSYRMLTPGGEHFDVAIAPFALREPFSVH